MTSYTESDCSVIESVNQFLGTPVRWQTIASKGTTNRLFKAQLAKQKLILRINAGQDLAFGVSRETEAQVLDLIQGYAWAPKVIKNNWQEGWCLMSDHGASIPEASCQAVSPLLLQSIAQWQIIPAINDDLVDYTSLFNSYQSRIRNTLDHTTITDNQSLLDQLVAKLDELPDVPWCLTHHDLHHDNLCGNEQQLTVLDWEYAGFGNPWFDAACLHAKFGIPIATIGHLPVFQHLQQTALKEGMKTAIALIEELEVLWLAVRSRNNKSEEQ